MTYREYDEPYRKSEEDVDHVFEFVATLLDFDQIDLADELFERAVDLRAASQLRLANNLDRLNEDQVAYNLCVWYGAAYMIEFLGKYAICKHELRRLDCGICSRDVMIQSNLIDENWDDV
tara:strand:- start:1594 stop:1953 length:360 start_codon:yes stop_codon:yes gene_type:complete